MHLYCNINCCPYLGHCGNGLVESAKVFLARNVRTRALGVVAAETIGVGEILGQYLGELEQVSLDRAKRPRNTGYRLLLAQRPERPRHPIAVAINAERLGSLMRFVNHSCHPRARFVEVLNERRTTVVVVTTEVIQKGEEIAVDYGDDLWFMVKATGSTNYKLVEMNLLLELVGEYLPLGKDEWERLAGVYNVHRPRSWVDRDFESLRRKFKVLYSTRKPTGCPTMPPHVARAKGLKKEIDEKANVVEMDDEADVDGNEEQHFEPDTSFDYQPEDGCWSNREECEGGVNVGGGFSTGSLSAVESNSSDSSAGGQADTTEAITVPKTSAGYNEFQELLAMPLTGEGTESTSGSTCSASARSGSTTRMLRSAGQSNPSNAPASRDCTALTTSSKQKKAVKKPAATGFKPGTRDEQEAVRYDTLLDYSTRLGGSDLYSFRDNVASKRGREEEDVDSAEASFVKVKRAKAIKATKTLKNKLCAVESATHTMGLW
ncbi:hypothetical protein PInf_026581 [Phytophthora infestans]|nr:hypothetical protein PInf_026581 [Phytophthora infestans]